MPQTQSKTHLRIVTTVTIVTFLATNCGRSITFECKVNPFVMGSLLFSRLVITVRKLILAQEDQGEMSFLENVSCFGTSHDKEKNSKIIYFC